MNTYVNTKTGAIVNSACVISGGDWEKVEKEPKEKESKGKKKK